jgi:pimeloyl-ACP methyl ester carboxylesterase
LKPFHVHVTDDVLLDLRRRLSATRLPPPSPAERWSDGTDSAFLGELLGYWRDGFDWRKQEALINALPQFLAQADDRKLHVVHARSAEADALPLLLIHGWPGSFWEFRRILPLLTDPAAHGGDPRDAFHVVIPSLPGYGWSAVPDTPGCDPAAIAGAFAALMAGLGYDRYGAQGGDWGSRIAAHLGVADAGHVLGLHLNFPSFISPPPDYDGSGLAPADRAALRAARTFAADGLGYLHLQSTRPQTAAFGLSDSPAGLAAWIAEKYREWSDGDLGTAIDRDDLLTIITIYWVTNTIGPSMRLYREHGRRPWNQQVPVPAGCAVFPAETSPPVRAWVEQFLDVRQWTEMPRGGHFAALEQPALLAADIRKFFRPLRASRSDPGRPAEEPARIVRLPQA